MRNRWIQRWIGCFVIVAMMSISLQVKASTQPFEDVSSDNPYWKMIQYMQEQGLINGYPDGTFRPNEQISRKHVAQLLNTALQLETKAETAIRYKDVPKNHPYYDAISKVSQAGIFTGDSNGNFNPDALLTRVQMAKVLDLAFDLNIKSLNSLRDVNNSHWGYTHVQALYSNGITMGDQGNFKPNQPVTRAHYAVFLYRVLNIPTVPKSDSKSPLTKEEIINLVYRLPITVEMTLAEHKLQSSQFNIARKDLLNNATQSYTDNQLKNSYASMCVECDMSIFPFLLDETDYRFEILENTQNLVRIRTVSFAIPLNEAGFVEYEFEKQSGKWKLSGHDFHILGAESFDLTKEEAIRIVGNDHLFLESTSANITFLNTEYDEVNDWYTKKKYRRLVYRMQADTKEKSFNIVFYPHDGSFYNLE